MDDTILKETPLKDIHIAAGAKMVPFAGWNMPVQYADGIIAEHLHTRTAASIFDICHMGEFEIDGPTAATELDRILARPVADQKIGTCRYNFLLNDDGGIQDDLIVYRIAEDCFFIVVNASTTENDAAEFRRNFSAEIEFNDVSADTGKIDLQGPKSAEILQKLGLDLKSLPEYYHWIETEVNGIPCLLSRTGYTGELGFEFYVSIEDTEDLWNLLAKHGAKPAGLGARDTIRLEMGYPLYGHELNTERTPIEAGFGAMLKLKEMPTRRFVGSAALKKNPPKKQLIGIKMEGRRAAREGMEVQNGDGKVIGTVTSGAFAPSLGYAVAMAWINTNAGIAIGNPVNVLVGKAIVAGTVVDTPFYANGTARIKL